MLGIAGGFRVSGFQGPVPGLAHVALFPGVVRLR